MAQEASVEGELEALPAEGGGARRVAPAVGGAGPTEQRDGEIPAIVEGPQDGDALLEVSVAADGVAGVEGEAAEEAEGERGPPAVAQGPEAGLPLQPVDDGPLGVAGGAGDLSERDVEQGDAAPVAQLDVAGEGLLVGARAPGKSRRL